MAVATAFGPIVIVFLAVSFATDHWLEFDVDRSRLDSTDRGSAYFRVSHDRHRGIFRECYPGNESEFLNNAPGVVDNYCFNIDYEMPAKSTSPTDNLKTRIHLSRCFLAFYIVAMVLFIFAFIFGMVVCCIERKRWAFTASLFAYFAAFANAVAIAFFHGAEYLERNKIEDNEYFYLRWTQNLKDYNSRSYGYSYILGWVGMALAALTATFYLTAGCLIAKKRYRYEEKRPDMMPMGGPAMGPYDMYYPPRGYPAGPMVYNMETGRPLPALGYGDYTSWS